MAYVKKGQAKPVARDENGEVLPKDRDLDALLQEQAKGTMRPIGAVGMPEFEVAEIPILGIAPYVQHRFDQKAQAMMEATQRAGTTATKSRKNRAPKDFEGQYEAAKYYCKRVVDPARTGPPGWLGIPCTNFRNALIEACRLVPFTMTIAKCSLFCLPDGWDEDGTPLVKIEGGEPFVHRGMVRNANGGADIRWRPMWNAGDWKARPRIRWAKKQFTADDVVNLMLTAGMQVGIGEGRPFSPNSNGMEWGMFAVEGFDVTGMVPITLTLQQAA